VRYTTSDGLHIAYQVSGGGDLDIVLVAGFVTHLEIDWVDPRHAHFLHRLGRMGRLIRFDKRGTGMSDRPSGLPDLETRMHDVLAVMDAVGSQRALVCGYSEGGPMAILLAATHPERVSSLVLYGSYAKRTWAPAYPWAQTEQARQAYTDELVASWDWERDFRMRCPSADPAMQQWWAQRMRAAATPSTIQAIVDMNSLVDVRDILPAVRVPTLVLHRKGDHMFQIGEAEYIAERIPGATLQLLDGADHFVSGDPDQLLDAIEPFVTQLPRKAPAPKSLAAIAAPAGAGDQELADALVRAGGRLRRSGKGRLVVLFDGPATAVRAGLDAVTAASRLGLAIDEVARDGDRADGIGVDLAIALADAAPDGQVYASPTAQVLLSGSGVMLAPVSAGRAGSTDRDMDLREAYVAVGG
jgi:pimeloyl-ACP methyl ester carboxylesterase